MLPVNHGNKTSPGNKDNISYQPLQCHHYLAIKQFVTLVLHSTLDYRNVSTFEITVESLN